MPRRAARRATLPLRLLALEARTVPAGGPLGPLQPPALGSVTYATAASGLPILHGLPGARAAAFLDFDGYASGTTTYNAFDLDGSTATFNAAEQAAVLECWRQVCVYYAPFDIDVTTVQPPAGTPMSWSILGNGEGGSTGGVATVSSYPNSAPKAFNETSQARTRQSGVAHEIGHVLGLSHQSDYDLLGVKTAEYSDGPDLLHAPIMGVDYAQYVHKWYLGHPSGSPSSLQDDLTVIATRIRNTPTVLGDGYRTDDHGNTAATATAMQTVASVQYGWGTVERAADVDAFSVTVAAGRYAVAATPTAPSGVDIRLEVYNAAGDLLAAADGATNDQTLGLDLPAGTYTLLVAGHGDYGDNGAYVASVRALPAGWATQNIGPVIDGGYAGYDAATDTYAVGGSGSGIGGTADRFRFAYTPLTGNGSITAKVVTQENSANAAKAGVMVRETLAADARYALMSVTPASGAQFLYRTAVAGSTTTTTASGVAAPYWVRLTRTGNTLTGFRSADGVTWTQTGTATVSMASTVYVGLAVASNNTGQTNPLSDATFISVTLTGTTGPAAPTYNALPAPTGFAVVRDAAAGVTATWDAVTGATGYRLERSADNVTWATATTATGLTAGDAPGGSQRWFYRVTALDASGASVPTAAVPIVTRPVAPGNLAVTVWTNKQVLNWSDVSGDTGYRVERSADGGTTWATLATLATNTPSYTDSSQTNWTGFSYRVVPLSSLGDGVATAPVIARLAGVSNLQFSVRTATQLTLSWTAVVGATGYRVEKSTDGTTYAAPVVATGTTFTDTAVVPLGEYYYRVTAFNATTDAPQASALFGATLGTVAVPTGWTAADVGAVGGAGATGRVGAGYTVVASGTDIYDTADAFRFTYRAVTGDATITARVPTMEYTDQFAKAGVMVRESLAAGSRHAAMLVTPTYVSMGVRAATNGTTTGYSDTTVPARWVRLVRSGDTLTGYQSYDGQTWTVRQAVTLTLGATAYVGLALSSHDNAKLNTAVFDNVSVVAAALPPRVLGLAQPGPRVGPIASLDIKFDRPMDAASFDPAADLVSFTGPGGVNLLPQVTGFTWVTPNVLRLQFTTQSAAGTYNVVLGPNVLAGGVALDQDGDGTAGEATDDRFAASFAAYTPGAVNFPAGFASGTTGLTLNGGVTVTSGRLRLTTTAANQARSVFTTAKQLVTKFATEFTFQLTSATADGFTFTVQGAAPTAVGTAGGNLGYGGIATSAAVKFDLYNSGFGEGANSTGLFVNGATPSGGDPLTGAIDLHATHLMRAAVGYDGTDLTLTLTDTATGQSYTRVYGNVDLPTLVGGPTAYVGFTAGTGGSGAIQEIVGWSYAVPPAARVAAVTVNPGETQRSQVTSVAVRFDQVVTFAGGAAGAFLLQRIGGGSVGGFTATVDTTAGYTVVTLAGFTGTETQGGSLADGYFRLTALAAAVTTDGQPLDGDGNGTAGGNYVSADNAIFRYLGDADGDGAVDGNDLAALAQAFNSVTGDANYRFWLDLDGDGAIDGNDLAIVAQRFNTVL